MAFLISGVSNATSATVTNADSVATVPGQPITALLVRGNASAIATSTIIGLVLFGALSGATQTIVTSGPLTLATTALWDAVTGQVGGLTTNAPYFLDVTTGKISTTAPSARGQSVVFLGYAYSTTTLVLSIAPAVLL